jgi:tetratricopeptide (TPR) repeat protein
MAETEVFVKYGLLDRAIDHLRRVFELQPHDLAAREKLSDVLAQLGRRPEAAAELMHMARYLADSDRAAAVKLARRALELDPSAEQARALVEGGAPASASPSSAAAGRGGEQGRPTGSQDVLVASSEDIVNADDVEIEVDPYGGGPDVLAFEDDPLSEVNRSRSLADGELVAEMEQVDFFIEQAMPDEAGALLTELQHRFGQSAVIDRKMHEVRQLADGGQGAIPGVPATMIDAPSRRHSGPVARVAGGGTADLSTHGDLGIAYKEMGLWDPAIEEFKILGRDPRRQVFALTMIGECLEAKGSLTDAVIRFKEALNCPQASATETTVLYYLLGDAFERLSDRPEALYFYEKVSRRDPRFREVAAKLVALRPPSAKQA